MRRTLLVAVAFATMLAYGPAFACSADEAAKAPAAAPAVGADQPVQPSSGCMAGGGCCGSAECAQMMGAEHPLAAGGAAAETAGGCPCMKNRAKAPKSE